MTGLDRHPFRSSELRPPVMVMFDAPALILKASSRAHQKYVGFPYSKSDQYNAAATKFPTLCKRRCGMTSLVFHTKTGYHMASSRIWKDMSSSCGAKRLTVLWCCPMKKCRGFRSVVTFKGPDKIKITWMWRFTSPHFCHASILHPQS